MAIKNKNLMMSLTESLNENKKQEIANFKKLKEATEDNISYVRYLLDTAEDMDDVQQAIYQIDDTDLENEVQLMFDSCSEDDSLEEVISLVVSTMEDNAEYDEEMNESEIDDARKDSIEKGLVSEDENFDESNENDRKNTLIAKKDKLESRLGDILQSIKDKQMDTEEFRKLSREAADLDSQIMDLDNQIRGVYECDKQINESELFNMDVYKDLEDEDENVDVEKLKLMQDYVIRKTKEIINYVYYYAPYSGIGDNMLNDMLNVIKEYLPNMNESINESDDGLDDYDREIANEVIEEVKDEIESNKSLIDDFWGADAGENLIYYDTMKEICNRLNLDYDKFPDLMRAYIDSELQAYYFGNTVNESDEDVCKGITDLLVSAGMTKEQAEQTAKGICNIFKNKVGSNQVVNEADDLDNSLNNIVWDNIEDYDDSEKEEIRNILQNLDFEVAGVDGHSVSIKLKQNGMVFWIDYSNNGSDIVGDWNQYIFDTTNSEDRIRKAIQTSYYEDTGDTIALEPMESAGFEYLENKGIIKDTGKGYSFTDINESVNQDGFPNSDELQKYFIGLSELPDEVEIDNVKYKMEQYGGSGDNCYAIYTDINNNDSYIKVFYSLNKTENGSYKGISKINGVSDLRESANPYEDLVSNVYKEYSKFLDSADKEESNDGKYTRVIIPVINGKNGKNGKNGTMSSDDIQNTFGILKDKFKNDGWNIFTGTYNWNGKSESVPSDSFVAIKNNESVKPIKEAAITEKNLLKSQGNVYMFECKGNSDFSHIVGENYNEEENTLENVETYNNKEDADKDYLGRCEITTESQKPRDIEDGLDESEDTSAGSITEDFNTDVLPIVDVDMYSLDDELSRYNVSEEELDEIVMDLAPKYIKDTLDDILPNVTVTAKSVYHPKEYNFSGDELEFDLTLDGSSYNSLKEKTVNNPDFAGFLKSKYSSGSGFISSMASDLDEFNTEEQWKQIVQVLMFNIPESVVDYNNENYKNEFLDTVASNFDYAEDDSGLDESVVASGLAKDGGKYKKIDLYVDGKYYASTNSYKTVKDAVNSLKNKKEFEGKSIKGNFSK